MLTSEPTTRIEDVLSGILQVALRVSNSDAGGAVLVTQLKGNEAVALAVAASGVTRNRAVQSLLAWLRRTSPSNQSACRIALTARGSGSAGVPFTGQGRVALLSPLMEHRTIVGILAVESSRTDSYTEEMRVKIETLAAVATLAISRVLLRERLTATGVSIDLVGISPAFLELERQVKNAAAYSSGHVLITGERGSGKELAAQAIHGWSDRQDKPFVPILASALAGALVADELYGHEPHAFTGASRRREGKFQAANGGTVFLDEVADMPMPIQSSLLRVVERGEMQRVGRDRPIHVDTRVIAATNRNLKDLMIRKAFRSDLYDRLSVFEIRVPPLRERPQDIPLLANYFLRKYCHEIQRHLKCSLDSCAGCDWKVSLDCISDGFYEALQSYSWPGNVRELANLMLRLQVSVEDEVLRVEHLPAQFVQALGLPDSDQASDHRDLTLEATVRSHIESVLRMTGYKQSHAARLLGLPYSTLQSKIKKLGIQIPRR